MLHGEQGSGKSTQAKMVRSLVDPNEADLRTVPRDERDLVIAASNAWILTLDNVSSLQPWLSDALCRLSTGGGFATRELYSDADEVIFSATRPTILTGIAQTATRGDLLDRAIIVDLPVIPEERRREESALWSEFHKARPTILGALCTAVSVALRRRSSVRLDRLPRMADFAVWVLAGEPGLGLRQWEFLQAYAGNRADAVTETIESHPVGPVLLRIVESGPWSGSPAELLEEIERHATDRERRQHGWPTSARGVSASVKRLAPALRACGIAVEFGHIGRGAAKKRAIRLRPLPEYGCEEPSPPTGTVPTPENNAPSGDGGDATGTNGDEWGRSSRLLGPVKTRCGDGWGRWGRLFASPF